MLALYYQELSKSIYINLLIDHRSLQHLSLQNLSRNLAESNFRSLFKIPYCCLRLKIRPYSSSNATVHSLKPVNDNRLGKLLTVPTIIIVYRLILHQSIVYSMYMSVCYTPGHDWFIVNKYISFACIMPIASVYSEPKSNSTLK